MTEHNWRAKALGVKGAMEKNQISDDEDTVILVQGKNVFGDDIYCYLKLPFKNFKTVKTKLDNKEKFDLRDYGDVVAAGLGAPTDEVREEMQKEYGMIAVAAVEPTPEKFDFEEVDEDDYPF